MFVRRLASLLLLFAALVALPVVGGAEDARTRMAHLADSAAKMVRAHAAQGKGAAGKCHSKDLVVRKEWGSLTREERRDYIRALKCLKKRPPKTDGKSAPGVKSRYDDFVVAHISNTYSVHFSPLLPSFHRALLWEFEKALRSECGLKGGQPYWDWPRYLGQRMEAWPLFDGSDTSLGGNGHVGPHTKGCSCVDSGPLKDWQVTLGPVGDGASCVDNPQDNGLGYNPRCLERKFEPKYLVNITYQHVLDQLHNSHDINSFGLAIEGWPKGCHPVPHAAIGGLQNDIPASPSDPWFWFHHNNLDRMWLFWASLDWPNRWNKLGTVEAYQPMRAARQWRPAKPIGPDPVIHLGPAFPDYRVRDTFSPTGGPFCYVYE